MLNELNYSQATTSYSAQQPFVGCFGAVKLQLQGLNGSTWWFQPRDFSLLGHVAGRFLSLVSVFWHRSPLLPPVLFSRLLRRAMASPRLETFCCPNRDAATDFVVTFQPVLFGTLTLGSAVLSLLFSILQLLPKRKGYRRLGQYPLPRPASSSRILLIISVCDMLGCAGKRSICVFLDELRATVFHFLLLHH